MSKIWQLLGLAIVATAMGCGQSEGITRVSRQNNSGTYAYFRETVVGKDREFKLGSIDQSGSKDVVELVSKTPSAIGYSGMGYATPEVKMLKISEKKGGEGVAPTMENAKNKTYPLARKLYIYTVGEPEGATKHFLDWILSEEGQAIVTEIGYVPIEPTPLEGDAGEEKAIIKVAGSDTMVNLGAGWAEKYSAKFPNIQPQVAGGGSGTGIAKLIDGTVDLANASREMKPEEIEKAEANAHGKKVKEYVVGLDALAVYVHKQNPLDSISMEDLAEIYGEGGTITKWTQVSGWPNGK